MWPLLLSVVTPAVQCALILLKHCAEAAPPSTRMPDVVWYGAWEAVKGREAVVETGCVRLAGLCLMCYGMRLPGLYGMQFLDDDAI